MRPVLHGDATTTARALLAVAPDVRPSFLARLIARAEAADRYRLKTGRAHPLWGNGTLMACAFAHGVAPEPGLDAPDYLDCLIAVLAALRDHTPRPPARQLAKPECVIGLPQGCPRLPRPDRVSAG